MPEVYITIPNIPVTLKRKNSRKAIRDAIMEALEWIAEAPSEVCCWVHNAELEEHGCLDCFKPIKTSIEELEIKGRLYPMPQEQQIIVVEISGGVLQNVWWNGSGDPRVELVDWDDEGRKKDNEEISAKVGAGEGWKEVR